MTASHHAELDEELGVLAALPGLETVITQLASLVTVLRAEQARRQADIGISRPMWKNLVFVGGPGTGKSRVARAIARFYYDLGLLTYGQLIELAAADLVGSTHQETVILIEKALKPSGDLLMITDAHTWHDLPDGGRHVLGCLYGELTKARQFDLHSNLAVILAGQATPLRGLLHTSPALAARFAATIDFPGYTATQLTAVFAALAAEAGFTIAPAAERKAAALLASIDTGNARIAVQLLTEAAASQAQRMTRTPQLTDPVTLRTINALDIPDRLHPQHLPAEDQRPGQYL